MSMKVKLAVPIWNGRVSPVMDTAHRLLLVEVVDGAEVSRTVVDLPQASADHRARFISEQGVETLICGALSQDLNQMLTAAGVKTVPWFRGGVEAVIAAHLSGNLHCNEFLLPGCGRRRRGMGRNCRRRAGREQNKRFKEES